MAAAEGGEDAAALSLTKAARGRQGRKRSLKRQNFSAWSAMDAMVENKAVRSIHRFKSLFGADKIKSAPAMSTKDLVVEDNYAGARLTWPLTSGTVIDLLESFKDGHVLHAKFVLQYSSVVSHSALTRPCEALTLTHSHVLTQVRARARRSCFADIRSGAVGSRYFSSKHRNRDDCGRPTRAVA